MSDSVEYNIRREYRHFIMLPHMKDDIYKQGNETFKENVIKNLEFARSLENSVKRPWQTRIKTQWEKIFEPFKSEDANAVQRSFDKFFDRLEKMIEKSPPGKLKRGWLDVNKRKKWYAGLTDFIIKLPFRVASNLLILIYSTIKNMLYGVFHPIKALKKFGDHVIDISFILTKPLTWTKIGAGIIGASVGSALVTGNPVAAIGLSIGATLILGGMAGGAIIAALGNKAGARKEALKREFKSHIESLPAAFLTGFLVGIVAGSIMKAANAMDGMESSSGMGVSASAKPPPPTLGIPPYLAAKHHKHDKLQPNDKNKEK